MFIEHLHCVLLTTNCLSQRSRSKCSSISPVAGTAPTQVGAATYPSEDLLCMLMASQIGQTPRFCGRAAHPQQGLPWSPPSLQACLLPGVFLLVPIVLSVSFFLPQKGAKAQIADVIHKRQHGNCVWGRWMVTREAQSTVCCASGGWTGRNAGARTWVLSCSGQGAMNMQRWLQQHLFLPKPGRSWAKRAWLLHFRPFTTQLNLLLLLLIVLCMFRILSPEGGCFILISCCIRII